MCIRDRLRFGEVVSLAVRRGCAARRSPRRSARAAYFPARAHWSLRVAVSFLRLSIGSGGARFGLLALHCCGFPECSLHAARHDFGEHARCCPAGMRGEQLNSACCPGG
eukprot:14477237-Alexandrium_andersonii.AAC.1